MPEAPVVPEHPVVIVGFVPPALASLAAFQAEHTVIFIDEPDVIRKRDVTQKVAGSPLLRELIEWEYQLPGAADEFYNAHRDLNPAAVVPLVEYGTVFAARLAERYGLPGAGLGAAEVMRDKSLLRKVTGAAVIANPESRRVQDPEQVREFMATHPGPVVLKPANRQAAVGTKIIESVEDVGQAWVECVAQDEGVMVPDRVVPVCMLVERCIRGREYSVEMLVRDGCPMFVNITDKLLYPGPRPIELGHLVPADVDGALAGMLRERTAEVLRAVGFGSGVVHCEWIHTGEELYLVECAGRFPGDGIAELIERAYPIDLVRHFYTLMRGEEPPPLPVRAEQGAAVRFIEVEPGEVDSVDGVDAACEMDGVVSCSVAVRPGETVRELRSSWDRIGSAMACAPTAAEAMQCAEAAVRGLEIKVRPLS